MEYQGPGYQTGPRLLGPGSGPQRAMSPSPSPGPSGPPGPSGSSGPRDPVRGFPPGPPVPPRTDDHHPEGNGYPPGNGNGHPQANGNGYPEGNAYSPISGYRRSDWHAPELATGAQRGQPAQQAAPGQPAARPRRLSRLLRRPVLLSMAGVLVLAGGGAAAYHFVNRPHSTVIHPGTSLKLPATSPTAGSRYFSAKLGKWQHIGTRKQDPAPLTVAELFPPAFQLPDGSQFTRSTASVNKDCTLAVFGQDLQTALQSPKCTQVLRASYVSGTGKMMGTIGVVNLGTAGDAQQAGKVVGAQELIAPLSASKGPTKNLLQGTGLVYAVAKGHYLILMYVEFTNTKSPSGSAQKLQLVTFAQDMFKGSASISLDHRMLYGKPAPAA